MNDTHDTPPPGPDPAANPSNESGDPGFDASRVRTITDMTRSTDDRMIAGVCAGAARHLGIDPVILRIIVVALMFVGLSGLILYLAAWFLLPSDDGSPSVAADWFGLDRNEPQVRTIGLVVAAVLAAGAIFGDSGWFWWSFPWIVLPTAAAIWLFWVLPRRRRETGSFTRQAGTPPPGTPLATAGHPAAATTTAAGGTATTVLPPTPAPVPRAPRTPPLLLAITVSAIAITFGAIRLWAETTDTTVEWTTYTAAGIGVVGLGLLVGSWWGRSWALPLIGLAMSAILALGAALPSAKIGEDQIAPSTASAVESSYALGMGRIELDLSGVRDVEALRGRTVKVRLGVGETVVIVPRDLPVRVEAEIDAGAIEVFGRQSNGGSADLTVRADEFPALTLQIDQTFGHIKVVRS